MEKTGGIGFFGLLTILFIALKLTGHIDWSWWWVLGPLWIPAAVFFGFVILMSVIGLLIAGAGIAFAFLLSIFRR